MKHLDLFSGIGGFALSASWVWGAEHKIHSFVEIEPFCQKVLKKHWPNVSIHDDIRTYKHDGTAIDLLTGGFPCQPFSQAGKQRGTEDERYLWPAMLRIIQKTKPTWIIGENVAGLVNMELENAVSDLEADGYEVEAIDIPAIACGAVHTRRRIWIVAHTNGQHGGKIKTFTRPHKIGQDTNDFRSICIYPRRHLFRNGTWNECKSEIGRMVDGIPQWMDRNKALGNAIVPQVVVPIMQAIKAIGF